MSSLFQRKLVGLSVAAILLLAIGTPWFVGQMAAQHGEHGMAGCPLMMGKASICPMQLADHIALWRNLFATALPQITGQLLLIIVVSGLPVWLALLQRAWLLERVKRNAVSIWLQYLRQHPRANPYGTILWAFARGILHPKIYPAVNV